MAAAAYSLSSSSSSIAAATARLLPTPSAAGNLGRCPGLPRRSSASSLSFASSSYCFEPQRLSLLRVEASSTDETSAVDTGELFSDLKEKWDAVENKSTVLLYGGGALVALWLSSIIVGAVNSVPLLPKIMELVGLGYTGWFVYRYLLFKSSRKELTEDIESLKKKIAGTE